MSQFYTEEERESLRAELEDLRKNPDAGIALPKGTTLYVPPEPKIPSELRALLIDVLNEADSLLDQVNCLLSYAGSTGDDETHGQAITELRALLPKEGV